MVITIDYKQWDNIVISSTYIIEFSLSSFHPLVSCSSNKIQTLSSSLFSMSVPLSSTKTDKTTS
jgi:hypothetical protein